MTTSIPVTANVEVDKASYMEKVISWNVKVLLSAYGYSQTALAEALGIQRSAMSKKLKGLAAWSVADMVHAADFLKTKPESLMDDSLMCRMMGDTKKADSEEPASDGLLRLGLNQRPSDKQFSSSIVSIDLDMLFTVALALWGASLRFPVLDQ